MTGGSNVDGVYYQASSRVAPAAALNTGGATLLVLRGACRTVFQVATALVHCSREAFLTLNAQAMTQEQRNVCAAAVGTAEACSRTEATACCPARKAAISTVSPILLHSRTMLGNGVRKSGV